MSEFDKKAAAWDDNPDHFNRVVKIATYLQKYLDLTKVDSAMEYGSGTGLLSFALKDIIPRIVLMDNSTEMTKEAQRKVNEQKITSLHPLKYDIMTEPLPDDKYDLIYILQTLHHIDDTDLFLKKSAQLLTVGGSLVLIDLVKEDGSFHDGPFDGHKGFVQIDLEQKLEDANLKLVHYGICHTIEKLLEDGSKKYYPLFMMIGKSI